MVSRGTVAIVTLSIVAVAVFLRDPSLFVEPRFWAEEGTFYFNSALHRGAVDALANVAATPYNSYLHTIPLISTVAAAHWLPLESAPYATVIAWSLVLAALELVILFGRASLLDPLPLRILVALSPLLAVGANENWVNTLGAHFYCDLALVLLLLEAGRVAKRRRTISVAAFAAFALLSPTSWLLFPAVVGMALVQWRQTRPYLAVMIGAVLLQAYVHFAFFEAGPRTLEDPSALPHLFLSKLLLWPLFGETIADAYGAYVGALSPEGFALAAVAAGALIGAIVAAFALSSRRDATTFVLSITWLSAAAGYLLLGLSVGRAQLAQVFIGGRYAYFPAILLFALIAHQVAPVTGRRDRRRTALFAAALGAMLLVGMFEFSFSRIATIRMHGQPWREEVARFREDAGYDHLRIAPPGWVVAVAQNTR